MECTNMQKALLSNYEVYTLLQEAVEASAARLQPRQLPHNVARLHTLIELYFDKIETSSKHQSPENVAKVMAALAKYKLTKAERLMLLNNMPLVALPTLLPILDEAELRFPEEQLTQLLEDVEACVPEALRPPPATEEDDAEAVDDEDAVMPMDED
ncbi:hypothetical protein RI367_004096 [Sorochytrium milnesiophthora]